MIMHALAETALQVALALIVLSLLASGAYIGLFLLNDWLDKRARKARNDVAFRRNCRLAEELRAKESRCKEVAVKDQTRRGPEVIARGWER